MNLIVVGASYRTAPMELLERLTVSTAPRAIAALLDGVHVSEAAVLSTCNRFEVYAVVPAFHPGLTQLGEALAGLCGLPADRLAPSLYVHHGADAVRHVFRVAAGLDSMVAGEAQILGQLREAYQQAVEADSAGRTLHELLQQALRVGKRAHAETGIDAVGRSMVSAALDLVEADSKDTNWLVIGAGAMGALAVSELARRGADRVRLINRSQRRASRLAEAYGVQPRAFTELHTLLAQADVVVTATASPTPVLREHDVRRARSTSVGELLIIDLALPRDVEVEVGRLDGVRLLDVEQLGAALAPTAGADLADVERIVAAEVDAYAAWLRGADVAPTVAALRARADDVVETELGRLRRRRPDLTDEQRAELAHTVHRVVQRLLHQPTVRVRQLAAEPGGEAYTRLLRDLFDLDPRAGSAADIPALGEDGGQA